MKREILRMEHILCRDGEAQQLNYLSMQIFEGEIYGVLCLEQPGIDKMVELICWNHTIQNGQVFFREELVNSQEVSSGSRNRVSVIGRQSRLINDLTLADNLFVMREEFRSFIIPERAIEMETKRLLQELDIQLSPGTLIKNLGTFDCLVTELLKAIVSGDDLIVLWEISDLLSVEELPRFHRLIQQLAQKGHTFLYIYSHHEVLRPACDRLAIFKEGTIQKVFASRENIGEHITKVFANYTYNKLKQLEREMQKNSSGETVLELKEIEGKHIRDLSLCIHRGENVLLFDQNNTILDEVMDILGAEEKPLRGRIYPDLNIHMRGTKIALIQRDATRTMLFPEMSFLDNLCLLLAERVPYFWQKKQLSKSVFLEYREEIGEAIEAKNLYHLSKRDLCRLVYYRCLIAKPDLVVCLQPLSDMDMYLRPVILDLLTRLRNHGIAVLVLNTELYDTLYIADRLIQVEQGKVAAEYTREHFEEARTKRGDIFPD